jgi:hypothetical protein
MVYGWMPTILEVSPIDDAIDRAVGILNLVRQGAAIGCDEMDGLKIAINNSVVGASKVLHFLKPDTYPIWDSVVYEFIHGEGSQYQMGKAENYLDYMAACQRVASDKGFVPAHESMNRKMGYEVSKIRALELIMYVSESVRRQAAKAHSRAKGKC